MLPQPAEMLPQIAHRFFWIGGLTISSLACLPRPAALGWLLVRARPDALSHNLGRKLGIDVVHGVAPFGDGMAVASRPDVQVLASDPAQGGDAVIAIDIPQVARHDALADAVGSVQCRGLATAVVLAPASLRYCPL